MEEVVKAFEDFRPKCSSQPYTCGQHSSVHEPCSLLATAEVDAFLKTCLPSYEPPTEPAWSYTPTLPSQCTAHCAPLFKEAYCCLQKV